MSTYKTDSAAKLAERLEEIKKFGVQLEVNDLEVGARIKKASEDSGISFTDLARGCGVTDKVVWQWAATGKISKANLPTLARLCGVTVSKLLTGQDQDALFSPTDDKFLQVRKTRTGIEQTRYYPILTIEELRSTDDPAQEEYYKNPEDRPCLAWVGYQGGVGSPKFAVVAVVDWFDGIERSDVISFATDLIPTQKDFCIVERVGVTTGPCWGYLFPIGDWLAPDSGVTEFDEIKTWKLSQHDDDLPHSSDIMINDLKLDDVIAVAISIFKPVLHNTMTAPTAIQTWNEMNQQFKKRLRD